MPRPLLDRFLDRTRSADFEAYAGIVLRDVEELLNSRLSSPLGEFDEDAEVAYGLPDLTLTGRTEGELLKLAWAVRRCLASYEPRLTGIRVEARPPEPVEIDRLTVRIEAGLAGFEKHPGLVLELPVDVRRHFY
jgi:type VI secretion system lysozyme-like protein